jgi:hypothetical protein
MMPFFLTPKTMIPGKFEAHGFIIRGIFVCRPYHGWKLLVPPAGTSPFGQDDLIQGSGMFGSEYQVKMLEEYDLLTLPEDLKKCLERAIRMY